MKKGSYSQTSLFMGAQISWFSLVFIIWISFLWFSPFDRDYTSGELLDHFLAWKETGTLYPSLDQSPYRVLNYPPLFLAIVYLLIPTGISPLILGRLVNLLAFLLSVAVIFRWLRKEGCDRKGSVFLLSLLATSFPVLYSTGQLHLELLGIAFSLLGLYCIRRDEKPSSIILGAVACSLACFVKQTQAIPALIGVLWLLRYRPRNALLFGFSGLIAGGLGAFLLYLKFGPEISRHLFLYTVGTYSAPQLFHQLMAHFIPWFIFFVLALQFGLKSSEGRKSLRWWYFVGTSLWLLSSARHGASYQYFIEWSFATLLWIGPWLSTWIQKPSHALSGHHFWTFLLLLQIIVADFVVAGILFHHGQKIRTTTLLLPQICERIPKGAIIPIEDTGLARACHARPALHPFIMTSLSKQGLWDERPFLEGLRNGRYPFVVLPFDPHGQFSKTHQERWTPSMLKTFRESYRKTENFGNWVLLEYQPPAPISFEDHMR